MQTGDDMKVDASRIRFEWTWRGAAAVLVITAILAAAGNSLAPAMPTKTWLFWCLVSALVLLIAVVGGLVVSLQWRQFVLRKGGTDVQWLAFSSEPEGLVRLRKRSPSSGGQGIHAGLFGREREDGP